LRKISSRKYTEFRIKSQKRKNRLHEEEKNLHLTPPMTNMTMPCQIERE
jgi:hypothetical protein